MQAGMYGFGENPGQPVLIFMNFVDTWQILA